jgi:hypothetical protein
VSGPGAPTDRSRQDEINAAVAAYDQANPLAPLPRNTTRVLAAMFSDNDVCRRSLEAIAAEGFGRKHLPLTLRRLVEAGFLSCEKGWPSTYRLHLPPRRQP